MGFAATARANHAKARERGHRIVRESQLIFADSLVSPTEFQGPWTPLGNPELWKSPPPADYRPGNLQSSWFFSVGAPSTERTDRTDQREVNGMDRMPEKPAGRTTYMANSAPHAGAIETGHSSQAPVGIMGVGAGEFEPIVYTVARRLAG